MLSPVASDGKHQVCSCKGRSHQVVLLHLTGMMTRCRACCPAEQPAVMVGFWMSVGEWRRSQAQTPGLYSQAQVMMEKQNETPLYMFLLTCSGTVA